MKSKVHYLFDIFDVEQEIDDIAFWNVTVEKFCNSIGHKILSSNHHLFSPSGLTIVYILSESHLAIHTWPEDRFIAFEVFTCKAINKYEELFNTLLSFLGSGRGILKVINRGYIE
ncbi:adenosylmethionine decarboxylase, partial [Nodularia spumigena]|uniref:adenosylmethionine decarboxylase n=1 Tax=Nodularia spumigena TaxID=70799 RepID=UPI002B214462